ncbi:MAG: CopG family transcriptional regulator [Verrucomicrobiota bacterium]
MTISLKLPPGMDARLKAIAEKKRISKSAYIRSLLEEGLKREKVKPSLYDLMKDAIGCIDSGVTDKSTNPKYMKGYGASRVSHRHRPAVRAA